MVTTVDDVSEEQSYLEKDNYKRNKYENIYETIKITIGKSILKNISFNLGLLDNILLIKYDNYYIKNNNYNYIYAKSCIKLYVYIILNIFIYHFVILLKLYNINKNNKNGIHINYWIYLNITPSILHNKNNHINIKFLYIKENKIIFKDFSNMNISITISIFNIKKFNKIIDESKKLLKWLNYKNNEKYMFY